MYQWLYQLFLLRAHLAKVAAQQLTLDILEDKFMNWNTLTNEEQLDNIFKLSFTKPQVIFKHSTRCSISTVAKTRLDKSSVDTIDFYYLDLIANRNLSNLIAEKLNVHHESPQVILIQNGNSIYDESHSSINIDDLAAEVK